MTLVHARAPALEQIVTECSPGIAPGPTAGVLIASLRNWASTVMLWNLALEPSGGPVQKEGCKRCTGVVTVDGNTGAVAYGRDYYQLGQASSFIRPGARRIASNTFVTYIPPPRITDRLRERRARQRRAGESRRQKVMLVFNNSSRAQRFSVSARGRSFTHRLPAQAVVTFVWNRR